MCIKKKEEQVSVGTECYCIRKLFIYSKYDLKFRNVVTKNLSAMWTPIYTKRNFKFMRHVTSSSYLRSVTTTWLQINYVVKFTQNVTSHLYAVKPTIYKNCDLKFLQNMYSNFYKMWPLVYIKCSLQFLIEFCIISLHITTQNYILFFVLLLRDTILPSVPYETIILSSFSSHIFMFVRKLNPVWDH